MKTFDIEKWVTPSTDPYDDLIGETGLELELDLDARIDPSFDTAIAVPDSFVFAPAPLLLPVLDDAFASGFGFAEASFHGIASGSGTSSVSGRLSAGVGTDGASFASGSAEISGDTGFGTLDLSAGLDTVSLEFLV